MTNEHGNNHGTFIDTSGTGLPPMASFRSQQQTTYTSNDSEQTIQTGETLGKALQSVRKKQKKKVHNISNCLFRSIPANIPIRQHHHQWMVF